MQKVKIFYHSGDFSRHGMGRSETLSALIRNQQARGSTPRAGSSEINGLAQKANPFLFWATIWANT